MDTNRTRIKTCVGVTGALSVAAFTALAGTYTQDVAGVESRHELSVPGNVVVTSNLAQIFGFPQGTPLLLKAISWDVTIETFGASWLSEASVALDDSTDPVSEDYIFTPGQADGHSGRETYTEPQLVFSQSGIANLLLPDGVLRMEFHEDFDDAPEPPVDATWQSGEFRVLAEPFPTRAPRITDVTTTGATASVLVSNLSAGVRNELQVSTNSPPGQTWQTLNEFTTLDSTTNWVSYVTNAWPRAIYRVLSQ